LRPNRYTQLRQVEEDITMAPTKRRKILSKQPLPANSGVNVFLYFGVWKPVGS
jgi:hypothetical protein